MMILDSSVGSFFTPAKAAYTPSVVITGLES